MSRGMTIGIRVIVKNNHEEILLVKHFTFLAGIYRVVGLIMVKISTRLQFEKFTRYGI